MENIIVESQVFYNTTFYCACFLWMMPNISTVMKGFMTSIFSLLIFLICILACYGTMIFNYHLCYYIVILTLVINLPQNSQK